MRKYFIGIKTFSVCLIWRITINSRDAIIRMGISTMPKNPLKTMKKFPLGLIQSTTQPQSSMILPMQDSYVFAFTLSLLFFLSKSECWISYASNFVCRLTASWTNSARLSFIENQIQTCMAIQSATELEHWYSILGVHLSKHGDEKRIRTHLNDLLGTPDNLMELDGEQPAKETILVWNLDSASKWFCLTYRAFVLFLYRASTSISCWNACWATWS